MKVIIKAEYARLIQPFISTESLPPNYGFGGPACGRTPIRSQAKRNSRDPPFQALIRSTRGKVPENRDWRVPLREFRAREQDLHIVTIDGDSMEPLLSTGDRIMVDMSQRVPVPPSIFVIWDGMGLVAKRVEHVPNSEPPTISIRSVNPEYPSYERQAEEVNIIGRVVWAAKRL